MTAKGRTLWFAVVPAVVLGLFWQRSTSPEAKSTRYEIERAPFQVTNEYAGSLASSAPLPVASQLSQPASIVFLAEEGSQVKEGDAIVEFDQATIKRDVNKLQRDHALAKAELQQLLEGDQPLVLQELNSQVAAKRNELAGEQLFLRGSIELQAEGLMSEAEVHQQRERISDLTKALKALERRLELTREVLHPNQRLRAKAHLDYVAEELQLAKVQQQQTLVRAGQAGTVIYKPLHVNNEFRTVRVGDTVYRNQPFMLVADMSSLVVHCDIPESQLLHLKEGQPCTVKPLPFPHLELEGEVLRVGSMAHSISGKPAWQKYFHVVIQLNHGNGALRSGMSVTTHITSYHRQAALLIPRAAVTWEGHQAYSLKDSPTKYSRVPIKVGMANDSHYEVLEGLEAGDRVWRP